MPASGRRECFSHSWKYWGIARKKQWYCCLCHSSAPSYYRCLECLQYRCADCAVSDSPSSLHIASHSVSWGTSGWVANSRTLFAEHGFVVISHVLTSDQQRAVLKDCEIVAKDIVGSECDGNRGPGRYSFGVASSTGSMLHLESFAKHLLNGACSKLHPLLQQIFEGGRRPGFICTGSGGDFVVGGTASDQAIHSDVQVRRDDDVWLPPPFLSINFTVHEVTGMNGPIRLIPGTQLERGCVPDQIPDRWLRSRLCPVPPGAAIIRDVRTLHGGTRNLTQITRYLPSVEFASADFRSTNRRDCFPPYRSLPKEFYECLHPQIKDLCTDIVAANRSLVRPTYTMS